MTFLGEGNLKYNAQHFVWRELFIIMHPFPRTGYILSWIYLGSRLKVPSKTNVDNDIISFLQKKYSRISLLYVL